MAQNPESHRLQDLKEIGVVIDTWDDIFSDFDPRPLGERAVSEDFIAELKRRYRETRTGDFEVVIYAPRSLQDETSEGIVIQRLKRHFRLHAVQQQKDIIRFRIRGVIFVSVGVFLLSLITLATYFEWFKDLTLELLGIVCLPLGWFGIWEGFSKIVDASPKSTQDEVLFIKLAKTQYRFKYVDA